MAQSALKQWGSGAAPTGIDGRVCTALDLNKGAFGRRVNYTAEMLESNG